MLLPALFFLLTSLAVSIPGGQSSLFKDPYVEDPDPDYPILSYQKRQTFGTKFEHLCVFLRTEASNKLECRWNGRNNDKPHIESIKSHVKCLLYEVEDVNVNSYCRFHCIAVIQQWDVTERRRGLTNSLDDD